MAGSFSHIVDKKTGDFTMEYIENLGDAHEALEECYKIILFLSEGDIKKINFVCKQLNFPEVAI